MDFIADLFRKYFYENTPKEYRNYAARFDLAFVTPCSYQLRCKVSQFKGLITRAALSPILTTGLVKFSTKSVVFMMLKAIHYRTKTLKIMAGK